MELDPLIKGWFLGVVSSFGIAWLQSHLANKQAKKQSLLEVRLSVYSRLLSSIKSEERYPNFDPSPYVTDTVAKYNEKLNEWRKNRKVIKGIASEALLLTTNIKLKNKLVKFIESSDPEFQLLGLENLMREEIGI